MKPSKSRGAALLLSLWALFLLAALVMSWALNIDSRLNISGTENRILEAQAMARPLIVSDLAEPTYDPVTHENEFLYLLVGLSAVFVPLLFFLQRAAIRRRSRGLARQQAVAV